MANYTILLIDYEPRSIERFRDPLTAAGYAVEIATDGVSGIEAFHRLNPDMVLVEAMIPKKHGFEVCQELKRTPHGRRTPVIITTGVYKGRKYRTQALHIYGCDEYIEKPIAPEQLLEVVGKFFGSGSSGTPTRSNESEPTGSEPSGGSSARGAGGTNAKSAPSAPPAEARPSGTTRVRPTSVPQAVASNDTEDEIMARLDEIMPGVGRGTPPPAEPERVAVVAAVDQNPFAQMRAELDAELGAISGPLAFEIAPKVVPVPDPFRSDQLVSPSVLEALPVPDVETPRAPEPAPIPVAKDEQPGQIVNFDTKRSRKNKTSEKSGKVSSQEVDRVASGSKPIGLLAIDPPARVAEVTLPRGTIVESELESSAGRRGKPVVLWFGVGAVALVALYLLFPRGESNPEAVAPPPAPKPSSVVSTPPVPVTPPVTTAISEPAPQTPEPLPSAPVTAKSLPGAVPVAVAVKAPAPKKPSDRAPATTPSPIASAPRRASVPAPVPADAPPTDTHPVIAEPITTTNTEAAPPPEAPAPAPAPAAVDTTAGVEMVPDPAATAPASTIAPGTLIPIDEADTLPVAISHRPPIYSLQARQLKVSGSVIMNVLVNDRGNVDQVVLVTGVPGGDVNESAIRAAKSWTYRPATKNGVPVKVWKSEQIVFKP